MKDFEKIRVAIDFANYIYGSEAVYNESTIEKNIYNKGVLLDVITSLHDFSNQIKSTNDYESFKSIFTQMIFMMQQIYEVALVPEENGGGIPIPTIN